MLGYYWGYIGIMKKKKETTISLWGLYWDYSPPDVDRILGTWGPYYDIPKTIVYLPYFRGTILQQLVGNVENCVPVMSLLSPPDPLASALAFGP